MTDGNGSSPLDRVVASLEDEAFRLGGPIPQDTLLRICERHRLVPEQTVEVRRRLDALEIEVEEEALPSGARTSSRHTEDAPADAELEKAVSGLVSGLRRHKLLDRAQEQVLMRRIRAGEAAAKALADGSADPARFLAAQVRSGAEARAQFLAANIGLVGHVAKWFVPSGSLETADLVQEGYFGLMKAVERFDHTRELKFSTYAVWWIYQAISRALIDRAPMIRIPVHVVERMRKVARTVDALTREQAGISPSVHEVADLLGVTAEQVQFLLDLGTPVLSLDAPMEAGSEATLTQLLPATTEPDAESLAARSDLLEGLSVLLSELPERDQQVLRRRFGLKDDNDETLQEIGETMGVTRERIRQIEARAIKRLQHPSQIRRLLELTGDDFEVRLPAKKQAKSKE